MTLKVCFEITWNDKVSETCQPDGQMRLTGVETGGDNFVPISPSKLARYYHIALQRRWETEFSSFILRFMDNAQIYSGYID